MNFFLIQSHFYVTHNFIQINKLFIYTVTIITITYHKSDAPFKFTALLVSILLIR